MGAEDNRATTARIDLAHAAPRSLGRLTLDPPVRQIRRDDGAEEVVEPRVMQVLLALVQAEGGIVTRDSLADSCWEGRVVGEDAINRVISRIRRVAEGIGADSFRLETITKVGYRLIALDGEGHAALPVASPALPVTLPVVARSPTMGRRRLLGGLAALGLTGIGGYWWSHRDRGEAPSPEVAALMAQANAALGQVNPEGVAAARGILQRVTEIAPDYADGWGRLAMALALSYYGSDPKVAQQLREAKTKAAADRALAIDPDNAPAQAALARTLPRVGGWTRAEDMLRKALRAHPDDPDLLLVMGNLLAGLGWMREAARDFSRLLKVREPTPGVAYFAAVVMWASGRLDEADAVLDRVWPMFPKHFAVWFTRVYTLMYTGRTEEAAAIVANVEGRPNGIPVSEFEHVALVIRAIQDRERADIDAVEAYCLEASRLGSGFAENAIQWCATLGRLDAAFAIADAYYFSRGFVVPDSRFAPEQGGHTTLADRRTYILFLPSTAAMRRDARFGPIVQQLGLERYWAARRRQPDYRLRA